MNSVVEMEDSFVDQDIFKKGHAHGKLEGKLEGSLKVLIKQGTAKFGRPDDSTLQRPGQLHDANEIDRLLTVATWDELFGE